MHQPKLEVADIFCHYGHLLGVLSAQKKKIVAHITRCRTAALGGHLYVCDRCDYEEQSYNSYSCRDRHCPKCQYEARRQWVEQRIEEPLPAPHFHVVFTLPHLFNELILTNKTLIYNLLFEASSQAVKEVFHTKYNALVGVIAIVHSWGQNLSLHPHIHMVIPAGGISDDKSQWKSCDTGYFLAVQVLSEVFRAKFIKLLRRAFRKGKLNFGDINAHLNHDSAFEDLLNQSFNEDWVVHSKKTFSEPLHVLKYLGNYTHRIAFSNYRLIKIQNDRVYFTYKDYKQKGKRKVMSLGVKEFMRRFLLHVVPKRFIRIRYYGFLSSAQKHTNIALCRKLIKQQPSPQKPTSIQKSTEQLLEQFKETAPMFTDECPKCKTGKMISIKEMINDSS